MLTSLSTDSFSLVDVPLYIESLIPINAVKVKVVNYHWRVWRARHTGGVFTETLKL